MRVTIITPTFNSEKTIGDTLHSVSAQDYPYIEHIIVDGKSTDNTLDIINNYAHVSKIISEKDTGIYDAMNKGLIAATGDIIAILNSDDFYAYNSVVTEMVNNLINNRVDCCYADLDYVDRDNPKKVTRVWFSGVYVRSKFKKGWMPPHPTFFAKRELYEKYGGFNLLLNSSSDYELMFRFLYVNEASCAYLPKTIVKMRRGGYSNISIKNRIVANLEDQKSWKINRIPLPFALPFLKPFRKIPQFFPNFAKRDI